MKRRFFIILGLISIIIFSFVINRLWYAKQTLQQFRIVYIKVPQPHVDTSTWKIYSDAILKYSIKYPPNVQIAKDSTPGIRTSFYFRDTNFSKLTAAHPNYESLDIVSSGQIGKDASYGYTQNKVACGVHCNVNPQNFIWININNAYGIDKSLQQRNKYSNIYITDSNKSGDVIHISIQLFPEADNQKIDTLEQMIRTFRFNRD